MGVSPDVALGAVRLSLGHANTSAERQATLAAALYPPRALPFISVWGPTLDRLGRHVVPGSGAFNVLTIDTHGQEHRT